MDDLLGDDLTDDPLAPVFSRGATSPLAGKRTEQLKVNLTPEVERAFRIHAAEAGYTSVSDALRDLIEVTLFGPEHLVSVRQDQLLQLAKKGPTTVPRDGPAEA